jgi:hypothetical protein
MELAELAERDVVRPESKDRAFKAYNNELRRRH